MGSELETPGRQFWVVITLVHLMSAARTGANAVHSPPGCAGLGPAGKGMHRASKGRGYAIFPQLTQALETPAVLFSAPGTMLGSLCLQTWQ